MRLIKLLLSISFITLSACKFDGTDTGNPLPNTAIQSTFTYSLVVASCERLEACNINVDYDDCLAGTLKAPNFAAELGLDPIYNSLLLDEILGNEINATFVADNAAANICLDDIDNLNCADPSIINAYNGALTNPYEPMANIVPASCNGVLSE